MNYHSDVEYAGKRVSLLDCFIYATIDPGGGTSAANANSKTDKAGWTVGAVTLDSDFLILDGGEEYMEVADILQLIYKIHTRWRPKHIGVERMMYLQQFLYSAMQQKGKILPLLTLQHKSRAKADRIKAVIPFLKKTFFFEGIAELAQGAMSRWHERMLHGDDWIDSLAYFYDVAIPPSLNDLMRHREERQRWINEESFELLDARSRREAKAIRRIENGMGYSFNEDYNDAFAD